MKNKILEILYKNKNSYTSGEHIAQTLNVSRMTISKQIKILRNKGYAIQSSTKNGYRLVSDIDLLLAKEVSTGLPPFYKDITILETTTSTNDYLKNNIPIEEGYVVISNQQTAGKGRNGRKFISNKNNGIYMSIFCRPTITIYDSLIITACTSVAVYQAIKQNYHIDCGIKWVNDLLIQNKKIGGILCEASLEMNTAKIDYMIIGIGLNIYKQNFQDLSDIAASIADYTHLKVSRNKLIHDILVYFYHIYTNITNTSFLDIYRKQSTVLNQWISVYGQNETYQAFVTAINERAELVLKKVDGSISILHSGEVSIRNA